MKTRLLLISFSVVLVSCGRGDQNGTDDELVNPESVMAYEENDTLILRKRPEHLNEWLQFYSKSDSGFQMTNFKASGVSLHMDVLEDAISSPQENSFADLYIYSPDSSQYIDLVSYSYLKETVNGHNVLVSGDPDQQVVLVDNRSKKKKQLMYNGPAQLAEFAAWTGNSSFIIGMTSKEGDGNDLKAEIYFFHLKDSSFTNFLLNHAVKVDELMPANSSYLEYYLKAKNYEVK